MVKNSMLKLQIKYQICVICMDKIKMKLNLVADHRNGLLD